MPYEEKKKYGKPEEKKTDTENANQDSNASPDAENKAEPENENQPTAATPEKSEEKAEPEKKEGKMEEKASDESQAEENGEGADEKPGDEASAVNPEPAVQSAENNTDLELLITKAQLAAFKSGVRGDVVEDAVCLAMHDAKKNGEVTEKTIADALSGVLDRHPEWKNAPESANNIRVGADGSKETHSSNDEISKIFGNK